MDEVIKCVFADVSFKDPSLPTHRGPDGQCFAQAGGQMNTCCYNAGKTLILLSQIQVVNDAIKSLKGNSKSVRSKRIGLVEAVHYHPPLVSSDQ